MEDQRLLFGSKQLADDVLLAEAGVSDNSALYVLLRLLGGAKKRKKKTYTKPKKQKHKHKKVKLAVLKFYNVRSDSTIVNPLPWGNLYTWQLQCLEVAACGQQPPYFRCLEGSVWGSSCCWPYPGRQPVSDPTEGTCPSLVPPTKGQTTFSPYSASINILEGHNLNWSCFQVDDSGKVQRLRKTCPTPTCGAGIFMATHFNRVYW